MATLKEKGPEFDVGSVLGKAGGWLKKRAAEDIDIAYRLLPGGEKATIGEAVQLGGDLLTIIPIPGAAGLGLAAKGAALGAKGVAARGGIKAGEIAAQKAASGIGSSAAKASPAFYDDAIMAARTAGASRGRTAAMKELDFVKRMQKSGGASNWLVKEGSRRGKTASNFRDVMLARKVPVMGPKGPVLGPKGKALTQPASMGKTITKSRVRRTALGSGISSLVNMDSDWFTGGGTEDAVANPNAGNFDGAVTTGADGYNYRFVPDRAGAGGLQGTNAAYSGSWVRMS